MSAPVKSPLAAAYSDGPTFEPPEEDGLKFHLTYAGPLKSTRGADHTHELRKHFHKQLRQLWAIHPSLKVWCTKEHKLMSEELAEQYSRLGYKFVPLALESLNSLVALEIFFLREGIPGTMLKSADLDARLKKLIDALRLPHNKDELGGYNLPAEGEEPFYCLMEDDKLVSNITISTDTLLEATAPDGMISKNDARVLISVSLSRYAGGFWDSPF